MKDKALNLMLRVIYTLGGTTLINDIIRPSSRDLFPDENFVV